MPDARDRVDHICAVCGAVVPPGLLTCRECGRGVFAPAKTRIEPEELPTVPAHHSDLPKQGLTRAFLAWLGGLFPRGRSKVTNAMQIHVSRGTDTLGRAATRIDVASNKYVCDTCDRNLGANDGYLLTTKQVVLSVESWRRVFGKWKREHPALFKDHFFDLAFHRASSDTPWVICESCASMFSFDRKQARDVLQKYRLTGEFQRGQAVCTFCSPSDGGSILVEPTDDDAWVAMLKAIKTASGKSPST
jgi:ribosomal protein L40E